MEKVDMPITGYVGKFLNRGKLALSKWLGTL